MNSTGVYPLSSRPRRRFVPALRRISADLALPEPARSRVLMEMAADLESLYEHFRGQGLAEDEAVARAGERLLASSEAIESLARVHTTAYQRLVAQVVGLARTGLDLLLFAAGVVPLLALSMFVVLERSLASAGGVLGWMAVAPGLVIVGIAAWKAHQVFIARERAPRRLNVGVPVLLLLSVVTPVLGCIAFLASLVMIPGRLETAAVGERAVVLGAIVEGGTVFALSMLLGITAALVWIVVVKRVALVWIVVVKRVARVEQEESALLLGE